jgi:hypothetical protein
MRTNIEIEDKLMAAAMAAGGFKTKREAVEEGLRLVARRKVYDGLLALRGKLQWDDSDEGWAKVREQRALAVNEPAPAPPIAKAPTLAPTKRGRAK